MSPGDRVEITGGEHYARKGVLRSKKVVRGERCVTVSLDRALRNGERIVTVLEDHVIPEYQSRSQDWVA